MAVRSPAVCGTELGYGGTDTTIFILAGAIIVEKWLSTTDVITVCVYVGGWVRGAWVWGGRLWREAREGRREEGRNGWRNGWRKRGRRKGGKERGRDGGTELTSGLWHLKTCRPT
eukprot:2520706-Rhodomonas_salina.1